MFLCLLILGKAAELAMRLTAEDKKIIRQIQGDLPLTLTPFRPLAKKLGLEEGRFLQRVEGLIRRGLIRRFGAILRHQIAGFRGNAMVVWKAPDEKVEKIGRLIASHPAVSHCYLRPPHARWPYNLYTMIHGKNDPDCRRLAGQLSKKAGLKDYRVLFSKRELKKSSMRYFENTSPRSTGWKARGQRPRAEKTDNRKIL